ncbi:hypothetical protein BD31_I1503 [Candidatus Nitrosopumilus salaria BD31]|uniref:Uncharacterized protein n=1 Tax=Candidatus Nitrosopumilus salarius BD31 TaxID=859350 RepID=I3D3N9_9ARCH|nr:hypothetical protein [Candidatus Nitrosopumilus salaria]EIJ66332.1 hypothetical protein BD31_I1503 [Candidatus Nitrosopumilus salaria BD31]
MKLKENNSIFLLALFFVFGIITVTIYPNQLLVYGEDLQVMSKSEIQSIKYCKSGIYEGEFSHGKYFLGVKKQTDNFCLMDGYSIVNDTEISFECDISLDDLTNFHGWLDDRIHPNQLAFKEDCKFTIVDEPALRNKSTPTAENAPNEFLKYSMEKMIESKDGVMTVFCAIIMECDENILGMMEPLQRHPDLVLLNDGELFEKMILDEIQTLDKYDALSIDYVSLDFQDFFTNNEKINDPKLMNDLKKVIDLQYESMNDLSLIITELKHREYVFHPMFTNDQECLKVPYIEFPGIELPDVTYSKSELLAWSNENEQKITQYNEFTNWFYGENYENVPSLDDKNKLKNLNIILNDFEESVVKFEENQNSENLENLKKILSDINDISEEYVGKFLLISFDISEDHDELLITVSIESEGYLKSNFAEKCLKDYVSELTSENSVQKIDASHSQLSAPITFLSYDEKSSLLSEDSASGLVNSDSSKFVMSDQSSKKQLSSEIPSENIKCENGMKLIFKYDDSPACVKPETVEKLLERGWTNTR